MSKMSSKNREIFEKLDKLVKQPGISKLYSRTIVWSTEKFQNFFWFLENSRSIEKCWHGVPPVGRPWTHIKESNNIFSEDFVFGQSLSDLELNEDNMEEIISRCRHLQVETIRFTRWRQMDMLEDFIKSQNGSFEAKWGQNSTIWGQLRSNWSQGESIPKHSDPNRLHILDT